MPLIPNGYPSKISDNELIKFIEVYSNAATVAGRSSNYNNGPNYWKEMVDLGQNEISYRVQKNLLTEISNLKQEITLLKEDNEKSGNTNKRLNYITIFLALITGFIGYLSLCSTKPEKHNGRTIQNLQLEQLKAINQTIDSLVIKFTPFSKF
ncbi:MAG: hypothetical protein RIR12_1056 [Bacteroidota bacterium]|jgi:hypothetical protein